MTRAQLALVHLAKKQTGLDEDQYRAVLARGGAERANELDAAGFRIVMLVFEGLGFRSTSPRRPLGFRPGRASDAQLALIRHMWLQWAPDDIELRGLRTWLERKWKVSDLRFLSVDSAPGAITALKEMTARRAPPAA